jgi:hypothetical protein
VNVTEKSIAVPNVVSRGETCGFDRLEWSWADAEAIATDSISSASGKAISQLARVPQVRRIGTTYLHGSISPSRT